MRIKTFCPKGTKPPKGWMVFPERDVWHRKVRIICSDECLCSVKSPRRLIDLCLVLKKICAQHVFCALGISYILMSMEAPRRQRLLFAAPCPPYLGWCQEETGHGVDTDGDAAAVMMMVVVMVKIMTPSLEAGLFLKKRRRWGGRNSINYQRRDLSDRWRLG